MCLMVGLKVNNAVHQLNKINKNLLGREVLLKTIKITCNCKDPCCLSHASLGSLPAADYAHSSHACKRKLGSEIEVPSSQC